MNKLIISIASLLLLNLNASAAHDIRDTVSQIKDATQKLTIQVPSTITGDDNAAVYHESGFIHHLVFIDDQRSNTPVSFHDYGAWIVIFGFIVFLVITLLIIVKSKAFIAAIERKYGSETNQHRN